MQRFLIAPGNPKINQVHTAKRLGATSVHPSVAQGLAPATIGRLLRSEPCQLRQGTARGTEQDGDFEPTKFLVGIVLLSLIASRSAKSNDRGPLARLYRLTSWSTHRQRLAMVIFYKRVSPVGGCPNDDEKSVDEKKPEKCVQLVGRLKSSHVHSRRI